MLAGQTRFGASLSKIDTVKLHVPVFPATSVELYVIVVTPLANVDPEAGPTILVTVRGPQLSEAIVGTVQETIDVHCPGLLFCTILAGHVILGA